MYHSREDFIRGIVKVAQTELESNEDETRKGLQNDDTPELLQPDDGPGSGPREEQESFTKDMETIHLEGREDGYLPDAFNEFNASARQAAKDLGGLLTNYDKDAIVSRATPEAGQKYAEAQIQGFTDELRKITGR